MFKADSEWTYRSGKRTPHNCTHGAHSLTVQTHFFNRSDWARCHILQSLGAAGWLVFWTLSTTTWDNYFTQVQCTESHSTQTWLTLAFTCLFQLWGRNSKLGRVRVFATRNTWPIQKILLSLIRWDKVFPRPVLNTRFLTRGFLTGLFHSILVILSTRRRSKTSMRWSSSTGRLEVF